MEVKSLVAKDVYVAGAIHGGFVNNVENARDEL